MGKHDYTAAKRMRAYRARIAARKAEERARLPPFEWWYGWKLMRSELLLEGPKNRPNP